MPEPKHNANNIHYLTQDEMKRLLSVIESKRDKAIFFLAYRHGLRASEIGLLRRTDLDFKKARIFIQRLKGSYSGEYPLEANEIKILKSYLRTREDDSPYLFLSEGGTPISRIPSGKAGDQRPRAHLGKRANPDPRARKTTARGENKAAFNPVEA
jgi:integrase